MVKLPWYNPGTGTTMIRYNHSVQSRYNMAVPWQFYHDCATVFWDTESII